ncbi:Ig-like domain-containing protein [Enterovirga sp. GCM10030262]|uniref:Ig-like domain-containing protein n=1 Tax=Enterovirga sp. GCM10030262 TaxID=3273391 RepID=UPI00362235CA
MVASTLRAGALALVSYATDDTNTADDDILRFVVLAPIGSGTVIHFTDRTWTPRAGSTMLNDGSFTNAANEGTFTYTAGADIPVGTVITITSAQLAAAGINLSDTTGETIYAYQGTDANTPTEFLFAAEIADGNSTFNGSLVNTGLSEAAGTAITVVHDNASFGGHPTGSPQHQLQEIADEANNWHGSDIGENGGTLYDDRANVNLSGPLTAPDMQLFGAMTGGGQSDAIVRVDNDEASNVGANLTRLLRDNPAFISMEDIAFDLEDGVWFAVMNEGTDITRIVKGNIADLTNTGGTPTFTTVYEYNNDSADSNDDKFIQGIELDKNTNRIFFTEGDLLVGHNFKSIDYNGGSVRDWGPIDLAPDPVIGFAGGIEDFVIDTVNNTAYFTYVTVDAGAGQVLHNYIVRLTAPLNAAAPNPLVENYAIVPIANAGAPDAGYQPGRIDDVEGSVRGIDYDPDTNTVWFVTGRLGAAGTGGVFKLDMTTLVMTEVWQQPGNSSHNTPQGFPTTLLHDIEVDSIGDRYYLTDQSSTDHAFDGTPLTDENGGNIWTGSLIGTGAPTHFADIFEPTANGAVKGMEINYAPVITALSSNNVTYTETAGVNSAAGTPLNIGGAPTINDFDTTNLKGAVVAITGFQPGDVLGFTLSGGITGSYNASTGVLTLTGSASYAQYATVLDTITFTNSGDNPTDFGLSPTRTITFQVTDGLAYSDPAGVTVNVVGINDAPVNVAGAAMNFTEDTTGTAGSAGPPVVAPSNAVTGISVSDPDANPSTQDISVTLSVANGTLTIRTDVAGGLAAGEVTGNGTGTLVLTGTQNQINKTLEAVNGSNQANALIYTPNANFNGTDPLTITTNDNGLNGNDPGDTGDGTSEADIDVKSLNVADVNDAPTVIDTTQDAPTILEDQPLTNLTAPSVSTLFGASFSDALDDQDQGGANPTGTPGDTLAGIAIVANGSNANGNWQYWDGDSWENIGAASADAAKTFTAATLIRFNPALNYNGAAPTLTAHLIESGGPAITNGGTVDLNPAPPITGTGSVYSVGTVVLSQDITPVNDAPTSALLQGDSATWTEGQALAALLDAGSNASFADVDSANFDGGSLTVAITDGLVSGEDRLVIRLTGTVSFNATAVFVNGIQIGTYTGHNSSGPLAVTFDADATPAAVAELARAIAYNNIGGDNPTDGDRTITWTLVDGDGTANTGQDTLPITTTVDVDPVNDPSVVGGSTALRVFAEGVNGAADHIFVNNTVTLSDVDDTTLSSVTVAITANHASAEDVLAFVNDNAVTFGDITGSYDSLTGALTLTSAGGAATLAQFQAAARAVTYDNLSEEPTENNRTIQIRANDGDDDSNVLSFNLQVVAQNDSPSGMSSTITINEDSVHTLTSAHFGFSDVDGDAFRAVRFGAAPTGGTLYWDADGAGGNDPVAITSFPTGDYLVTDIDLGKLTFVPDADVSGDGSGSITFTVVDDGGTTGAGQNADTTPNLLNVNVTPINDEPEGTDNTIGIDEDAIHTFEQGDFGFSDPVEGDALQSVVITTLPAEGTILLRFDFGPPIGFLNIPVSAGQAVSVADIDAGNLFYQPAANGYGDDYASFTFQVKDDGGTANGGVDTDQSANTITFDVGAINDAPALVAPETQGGSEDVAVVFSSGNGNAITVSDIDLDGGFISVVLGVADGTLTLGSTAGLFAVIGDGTGQVAITGGAAAVNAALEGLTYLGAPDSNGSRDLNISVNDNGFTGPNLIVNPGAETGTGAADYTGSVLPDGWARVGNGGLTAIQYASGGVDPNLINAGDDSAPISGGSDFFAGGPGGASSAITQTIDVSGHAATIDGGAMLANVSGYFGGLGTQADAMTLTVRFLDVNGDELSTAEIGGTGPTDRADETQLLLDATLALLPPGTRSIEVLLSAAHDEGIYTDGYADNLSLTLSELVTDTVAIDLAAVNDAPELAATAGTTAFTEGANAVSTPVAIDAALTLTDIDDTAFESATVSITGNFQAGEDVLAFDNTSSVTFGDIIVSSYAGGILTLTSAGAATAAQWQAALQAVTYTNSSDTPNTATRTVSFSIDDGDDTSIAVTRDVSVAAANDTPVLDLNGVAAGSEAVLAYTENDPATPVAPDATLADPDSADFDGGSMTVGITANGDGDDRLTINPVGGGAGQIGVSGADVSYEGIVIGTFSGGTSGSDPLEIDFNASATPVAVEALLRQISYSNVSDDPSAAARTITYTIVDGDGGAQTGTATAIVNLAAVDDPGNAGDDSFTTDEASAIIGGDVFANDSDADDTLEVATVEGAGVNVGQTINLASGALLTLNADGTFDYDPNGAFDNLTEFGSGALNDRKVDTFEYTLADGATATVKIIVTGLATDPNRLFGSAGDDVITGTTGADHFLLGRGGNDTVQGLGGDDIFKFNGHFTEFDGVDGGDGRDIVRLDGDYFNEVVFNSGTMRGIEVISLMTGNSYTLTTADETVAAGETLIVTAIRLSPLEELWFDGSAETDGSFRLTGGGCDDWLIGGQGDDVINGQAGFNLLQGGLGNDIYYVRNAGDAVLEFENEGYDQAKAYVDHALADHVEELRLFGSARSGIGNDLDNLVIGTGGDDVLEGLAGEDLLIGGNGADTLEGGADDDRLLGEIGTDTLRGGDGNDWLTGGRGADTLEGGIGADLLFGGDAADILLGGDGDDRLVGGGQRDTMTGGAGADLFLFADGDASTIAGQADRITDFNRAEGDTIHLKQIDADTGTPADEGFAFVGTAAFSGAAGELRFQVVQGDSLLQGDVNGDQIADFYIRVEGVTQLFVGDFGL